MRSFAGLYFVVRAMWFGIYLFGGSIGVANNDPYFWRNIVLTMGVLLIAICRPYKKMYMNTLDTLLLAHFGLVHHLMSAERSFQVRQNVAYTFDVVLALPFAYFILFLVVIALKKVFICKLQTKFCRLTTEKCKFCFSFFKFEIPRFIVRKSNSWSDSSSIEQLLIDPSATETSYGAC